MKGAARLRQPSTRVAVNTSIMYVRMLITMVLSFFATRIILDSLGSSDYGLYSLIGGLIAMIAFVKTALANTTQRYLSYNQGLGDLDKQKDYFANSLTIHLILAVGLSLLVIAAGYFIFRYELLNIPPGQSQTAFKLYIVVTVTMFGTIVMSPFYATLIAHENIFFIACLNIMYSALNLAAAYSLYYLPNKVLSYGLMVAGITTLEVILCYAYCKRNYPECVFDLKMRFRKSYVVEMLAFAGWNAYSTMCTVVRAQGLAVLFNIFYGTIINAAYGIANQLAGQLNFISQSLRTAINPQIMKSEGASDRQRAIRLSMISCKFGFFFLCAVSVPLIFEMPAALGIWLKEVPEYTVRFCQFILIACLVDQLTMGLWALNTAIGNIRNYSIIISTIKVLTIPVAYVMLKMDYDPYAVMTAYVVVETVCSASRVVFLKYNAGMSIRRFIERVVVRSTLPVVVSGMVCWLVVTNFDFPLRFLVTGTLSLTALVAAVFAVGLSADERGSLSRIIKNKTKKQTHERSTT